MSTSINSVRRAILTLNSPEFTLSSLHAYHYDLHANTDKELSGGKIGEILSQLSKQKEIKFVRRDAYTGGSARKVWAAADIKLARTKERPVIVRKSMNLAGIRKVWPHYFTDPNLQGKIQRHFMRG